MKKYNVKNYVRYKEDVKRSIGKISKKRFVDYQPEELKEEKQILNKQYEKV